MRIRVGSAPKMGDMSSEQQALLTTPEPHTTVRDPGVTSGNLPATLYVTDTIEETARTTHDESERQRRLYETILNATPDLVYVFDLNHRFTYANEALLKMWGRTWDDAIGKNCLELGYEPWHAAMHDREIEEVIRTRRPVRGEVPFNGTNGRRVYDYIFVPVIGADGEVEAVAGTTRDITERKLSEEVVRESADRLRFMAESMPQKIFTAKPTGEVDYFNRQWLEFTGLTFDEIKDWGWTQFIHPDDVEENVQAWRHSIESGEPFQFVHRFRRVDGFYRWHLSRAFPMRDAAGKVSMWIGSNTDIHEEKEKEEDLRRTNEDLNQFAFTASHDLQEPLRMITSYSQLLVRRYGSQFDENASQYARYITESAQRMTELLNDLLSYARAGADTDGMVEVVDFNAIAAEAVENLQASIAETGATVICDPLPQVHGRQAHFVQLVQNLISNALKYRSEQPPDIHISAEQVRGRWRFAVTDNGIGIDPKYHQNIFGVFKRLHNRSIPGTGIGLAICQRVVERYGGRIWVESHAGHGATFYFTLPVMKDSQPAAQASAESA